MENVTKKTPSDYVIATGVQYSVKEFVNMVLKELNIKFIGKAKIFIQNVMMKMAIALSNVIKNILDH